MYERNYFLKEKRKQRMQQHEVESVLLIKLTLRRTANVTDTGNR